MKTLLAFLIAGMVFLVTPGLASADRGGHDSRQKYDQWQVQRDRNYNQQHNQYNHHYNQGYDQRYNHRGGKRDWRWNPRKTRHDLYRVKRHRGHNHHQTNYISQPVVLIGMPPLVFLFNW